MGSVLSLIKANNMRIKTVMNHNQNDGLLKMIKRTDPMISKEDAAEVPDVTQQKIGLTKHQSDFYC